MNFCMRVLGLSMVVMALSGCSLLQKGLLGGSAPVIDQSVVLEFPPGVAGVVSAAGPAVEQARQPLSEEKKENSVESELGVRSEERVGSLVVNASSVRTFQFIQRFWHDHQVVLSLADARAGLIQTDWVENEKWRQEAGQKSIFDRLSGGARERFLVRIEDEAGTARVFVSVRRMVEKPDEKVLQNAQDHAGYVWQSDPDTQAVERVALEQLQLYLSSQKIDAQLEMGVSSPSVPAVVVSAQAVSSGAAVSATPERVVMQVFPNHQVVLILQDSYQMSWVRLLQILQQRGFEVVGVQGDRGSVVIRYLDQAGVVVLDDSSASAQGFYVLRLIELGEQQVMLQIFSNHTQENSESVKGTMNRVMRVLFEAFQS